MNSQELDRLLSRYKEAYGQVPDWAEVVSQIMPDLLGPWIEIRSKVIADGALSRKVKELILLGINLVRRYPSGVETHMRGALDAGASKEEIMEVIATSILSSAAPAMYNGPRALKEELKKRKA
ncbi:MAG: carboxymuconolactone decarboxylase family protein [Deltaproteobacteria bacterium]|nr:carboxymuconolactone decarboxylase family protein [Deltaproteobacteria bacterium]